MLCGEENGYVLGKRDDNMGMYLYEFICIVYVMIVIIIYIYWLFIV